MFHSRKLKTRIDGLHERASRDFDSSFEELQNLMTEIFKVKTGIAPELMKGVFEFTDVPYNLRNQSKCNRSIPCAEGYGIEAASS